LAVQREAVAELSLVMGKPLHLVLAMRHQLVLRDPLQGCMQPCRRVHASVGLRLGLIREPRHDHRASMALALARSVEPTHRLMFAILCATAAAAVWIMSAPG
jgi:hypothetical protein